MEMLKLSLVSFAVLLTFLATDCNGVSLNQDLTLTKSQKEALDKFKANVLPKLTKDYQKSDIYLIRWLRAKNFNVRAAEEMLMSDLKWRRAEKMDNIHTEDWSDMEEEFPWFMDGYDNEGKPILTANYDEWDLRKGVVAGKLQRIMRWMTYAQESGVRRVRELQAEGKNVTQWHVIILNTINN
ncbi:Patellin-2 [Folsomia candida]|uniref:Patellin-2 n=1 Tax=Folsomia candida TaxID=158441 RepID=A0A226E5S3_FOLCA|nr:Patellin-2 [Folsomia candida]